MDLDNPQRGQRDSQGVAQQHSQAVNLPVNLLCSLPNSLLPRYYSVFCSERVLNLSRYFIILLLHSFRFFIRYYHVTTKIYPR